MQEGPTGEEENEITLNEHPLTNGHKASSFTMYCFI